MEVRVNLSAVMGSGGSLARGLIGLTAAAPISTVFGTALPVSQLFFMVIWHVF